MSSVYIIHENYGYYVQLEEVDRNVWVLLGGSMPFRYL